MGTQLLNKSLASPRCGQFQRDRKLPMMQFKTGWSMILLLSIITAGIVSGRSIVDSLFSTESVECYQGVDGEEKLVNCTSGWCRIQCEGNLLVHLCDVHSICERDAGARNACVINQYDPAAFICCCDRDECNVCHTRNECFQQYPPDQETKIASGETTAANFAMIERFENGDGDNLSPTSNPGDANWIKRLLRHLKNIGIALRLVNEEQTRS